ncbi:MAG TPA: type II secretion system protein N [Psychromonas hadalis]|nr:type II secretion system protein N [Psychromonas hadalis]
MKVKMIVLFVCSYLVFMVVTLPAKTIHYFLPDNVGVKAINLTGTIWNGQAAQVTYQRTYQLNNLTWSVDWLALFSLNAKLDIAFDNGAHGMSGKGAVIAGVSGVRVENMVIDSTATEILALANLNLPVQVHASGNVSLVIKEAQQGTPYCQTLDATLNWQQANVNSDFGPLNLNNAMIDLSCEEGMVLADLTQHSDQLVSNVHVQLKENNIYQLNGTVKGESKLDPSIAQMLPMIGPRNSEGGYPFTFSGRL